MYGQGSYSGPNIQGVSSGDCGYKQAASMAKANLVTLIAVSTVNKRNLNNLQALNISSGIPWVWCYLRNVLPMVTSLKTAPD